MYYGENWQNKKNINSKQISKLFWYFFENPWLSCYFAFSEAQKTRKNMGRSQNKARYTLLIFWTIKTAEIKPKSFLRKVKKSWLHHSVPNFNILLLSILLTIFQSWKPKRNFVEISHRNKATREKVGVNRGLRKKLDRALCTCSHGNRIELYDHIFRQCCALL